MYTVKNITGVKVTTPYDTFLPDEVKVLQQTLKGNADTLVLKYYQESPQFLVTGGVNEDHGDVGPEGPAGTNGTSIALFCSGLIAAVRNDAVFGVGVQGGAGTDTLAKGEVMIPAAGSLGSFRVKPDVAVTGLASVTVTLLKNGAPTSLTATFIAADGTTAKTVAGPTAVAAGDLITFAVEETANVAPVANFQASAKYTAS